MKNILISLTGILLILLSFSLITVSADYKSDYYDYQEMVSVLKGLETEAASKNTSVYSLHVIGYSHLNNAIYAIKFSDNPDMDEDDEPDVLIDAGIHANEWLPVDSTINFIQYLFDTYYDEQHTDHAEVVDLVHNFEIWIIPMINPDGRIRDDLNSGDPESFWIDTTYHDDDTAGWRMNVQEVDCSARPDGTTTGIDINRTFSYKFWEYSDCTQTIYNGGSAFAAPEARVLKQFVHNHMISLILHQHSNIQYIFSSSGVVGLGDYLAREAAAIYNNDPSMPNPLMALGTPVAPSLSGLSGVSIKGREHPLYKQTMSQETAEGGSFLGSGVCNGSRFSGQYFNWAWSEIDCILAPDNHSRRAIQMIMYEYPYDDEFSDVYGHPDDGKIGQYLKGDASNGFHPSSGEINQWVFNKSIEINKYFIKQSLYPFNPRNHEDMTRNEEAPETDLAMVGAKISEAGTGLPGCLTYDDNDGRDLLSSGTKRITWNVQNNGASNRTISSTITICNLTDDSECTAPTNSTLTRTDVTPEGIETFTYDYAFQPSKDYALTLTTGESNSYENDLKRYIFTTTDADETTTTTSVLDEPCPVEEIYGTDSDATLLLRYFRDNVLTRSPDGKELIKLYYEVSPAIVKTIKEDEKYKKQVKSIIDKILSLCRTESD